MKLFCIDPFKKEFDKLSGKKSYKDLESELIGYFFNKEASDLNTGSLLNNNHETPYIKKRLSGRGGYRIYYLLLIKNDGLYLMFVHPKTGSEGASNTSNEYKAHLYKEVLRCIKENDLYELSLSESGKKIVFKHLGD